MPDEQTTKEMIRVVKVFDAFCKAWDGLNASERRRMRRWMLGDDSPLHDLGPTDVYEGNTP